MRYLLYAFIWGCSLTVRGQLRATPARLGEWGQKEEEEVSFEHYGQEKGLSQGTINDIASYDSFMWFATQDGLNRFDGYGFKVFRTGQTASLNSNLVQTLLADSHGRLWIGTGAGLNLYDRRSGQTSRFTQTFGIRHAVDTVPIQQLIEDRQGRIWIQTVAHGLFCFDPALKKVKTYFPNNNALQSCRLAPDGQLWVSTFDELYRYDAQRDRFTPIQARDQLKTKSLFQEILFDKRGSLWVGTTDDGAFRLENPASEQPTIFHVKLGNTDRHLSSNDVVTFLCDRAGRVWIGTRTGGISIYHPETGRFTYVRHAPNNPQSLRQDFVWRLYQDRQGIIWVGSSSQGVDKSDPHRFSFRLIQQRAENRTQGLPDNMIFRLFGLDDQLYIGTETGGFARYSIPARTITSFAETVAPTASAMHNEVRVITADSDKNLWFANWRELTQYDPRRQTVRVYPVAGPHKQKYAYAAHMLNGPMGRPAEIWVAGHGGLTRFDLATKQWKDWHDLPAISAISTYNIRLVYQHSPALIWFGTLGKGLIQYDRNTQKIKAFTATNGLSCLNIRSLLQDGSTLWIGTDCGLFTLDLVRSVITKQYTSQQGPMAFRLPNDVIYGILKDNEGYLWLSSNQGLTRFSPTQGVLKNYDVSDGLQSNEFNTNVCYRHPDGTLFFGGVNGITYFKTGQLTKNTFVPPVRITGLTVLDSAYNPNQARLTLDPDQNFMAFEFAALNFSNTQKNQYQYKLEGIDPDWVQARHQRVANYTKLPPGNYVFRVKGSNDDGVWNEQGASLAILIKPPVWETAWFRVALIALLLGGLYGVYRYRIGQLNDRRVHELALSIRTQELERQRFAKELHDGVGTNLAVLKMYLTSLGTSTGSVDDLKARSLAVLRSSIDEIRSIIHDMHPRSLAEAGLVQTIIEMVDLINESHRLTVTFEPQHVPQTLPESVEINLFRVVQELLQNALKHANANAVWLQLTYEAPTLRLTYRDDGRGFTPSLVSQSSGNGLVNIKQRTALMKGDFSLTSIEQEGTTVEISVPVSA
ncbi:sensor histidine kinase [Spirosoma areae]